MSTTYKTVPGDTFERISRRKYGTEIEAGRIARANPGIVEPLDSGLILVIPALPDAPQYSIQQIAADSPNEVALLIDGQRFSYWEGMKITRSMDAMDTVEFGAPFEYTTPGFRETFRPLSFKPLTVIVGGEPLFTGIMVDVVPNMETGRKTIAVNGYSLPGILNDCNAPAAAYPLEFYGQGLKTIAGKLLEPFGIGVDFEGDPGAVFEQVAADTGKKMLTFIIELAQQRNFVVTSTPTGRLLCWQSVKPGQPVARLVQGEAPLLSVIPAFAPQNYYSHITGIVPAAVGSGGSQYTVRNPRLEGITRPFTFDIPDTETGSVKAATDAKAGRMFGAVVSYQVTLSTWRAPSGELWAPNTTLLLSAPDAMIYEPYEFLIRSAVFDRNADGEIVTLNLTLPGVFSGELPESMPWD